MILLTIELPKFRLIEAWLKHGYQEVTGWEHGEMLVKRYKLPASIYLMINKFWESNVQHGNYS